MFYDFNSILSKDHDNLDILFKIVNIGIGSNNANGPYAFFRQKWPKLAKNKLESPKITIFKTISPLRVEGLK